MSIFSKKKTTGIAFGGGAARGLAHIGVIKVLEEYGIKFNLVSGNSAGSIIGAFYAAGYTWKEMYDIAKELSSSGLFGGLSLKSKGLFKSDKLEAFLKQHLGDTKIEDLDIPFRCVAVNLYNGELVELSRGPLVRAIRASCSIPGVFAPTTIDDMLLVDGGIKDSVPGDVIKRMGADFSVAINLNADRGHPSPPKNGFDVFWSSMKITWNENAEQRLRDVDVIIAPNLREFTYYDLKHRDALVERGETATRGKIEAILQGIGK